MAAYPPSLRSPRCERLLACCQYNNGACTAPRVFKKNGQLHRYCDQHRSRSNAYQQKYVKSKLARRSESLVVVSADEIISAAPISYGNTVDELFASFMQLLEESAEIHAATYSSVDLDSTNEAVGERVCGISGVFETVNAGQ